MGQEDIRQEAAATGRSGRSFSLVLQSLQELALISWTDGWTKTTQRNNVRLVHACIGAAWCQVHAGCLIFSAGCRPWFTSCLHHSYMHRGQPFGAWKFIMSGKVVETTTSLLVVTAIHREEIHLAASTAPSHKLSMDGSTTYTLKVLEAIATHILARMKTRVNQSLLTMVWKEAVS